MARDCVSGLLGDGIGVIGVMSRHGIIVAMDDRSRVVSELYMAQTSDILHVVVKLAIGPNRAVSGNALELGVMRLVGHIHPRLNHGFGRCLNVLSIVVALLVKGRRGVPLASKIDDE